MLRFSLLASLLLAAAEPCLGAGGTITDQAVSLTYGPAHWDATPEADFKGTEGQAALDIVRYAGWWYRVDGVDTHERPLPPPTPRPGSAAWPSWSGPTSTAGASA